ELGQDAGEAGGHPPVGADELRVRLPQRLTRGRLPAEEPAGQVRVLPDALELAVVMLVQAGEVAGDDVARVAVLDDADDVRGAAFVRAVRDLALHEQLGDGGRFLDAVAPDL